MPPGDNQALSDNMIAMVAHMETSNKFLEALVESNEKAKKLAEESKKTGATTAKSIPVIAYAVNSINSQIKSAFASVVKIQEKGLARGMRLDETLKQSSTSVLYLNENLTGYTNALNVGFEMYESGARSNNKALARLALSTKVTGGNSLRLVKQLTSLNAGLDLSQDQQTRLNNSILSLSQNFGISTEELVGAIGGLKSEMMNYAALGVGAEMQEGTARLAAALGPEMAGSAAKFAMALTRGSSMVEASILGVSEFRNALTRPGADPGLLLDAMIATGQSMERMFAQRVEGATDRPMALEMLRGDVGDTGILGLVGLQQFQQEARERGMGFEAYRKSIKEQQKINNDFANAWKNIKEKFWDPIQKNMMNLVISFEKTILPLLDGMMPLVQAVVGLGAAIVAIKGIAGFFAIGKGLAALGAGGAAAAAGAGAGGLGFLGILGGGMGLLAVGLWLVLEPIKRFVPYLERLVNSLKNANFGKLFELARGLTSIGKAAFGATLAIPVLAAIALTSNAISANTPSSASLGEGNSLSEIYSELKLQTAAINNLVIGQETGNDTREEQVGELKGIKSNLGSGPRPSDVRSLGGDK